MNFWVADQLDELSLPISGRAVPFGFYLTQEKSPQEESSGEEDFSAENPFQSVDKIVFPNDILSRNRRNSWVAAQLQNEYTPIGSFEGSPQGMKAFLLGIFSLDSLF